MLLGGGGFGLGHKGVTLMNGIVPYKRGSREISYPFHDVIVEYLLSTLIVFSFYLKAWVYVSSQGSF